MQSSIHFPHLIFSDAAHILVQPGFVQRPKLLQQDSGVPEQATGRALEPHMGGLVFSFDVSRDSGGNDRGTMYVSCVILDHKYRPDAALLRANDRHKIRAVDVAAPDGPFFLYAHFFSLETGIKGEPFLKWVQR